jgi:hypothetical protein
LHILLEKETILVGLVMLSVLRTNSLYKDERAMTFQTFLAKTKHMFNIFEEVGESKPESAKIRFLLDGVRNTELQPIVQAIRAGMTLEPNVYTFTTAANMIASQVTPKETNRSVSALGKESGDKTSTEFLPVKKWRALSAEQQATIRAARDKKPKHHEKAAEAKVCIGQEGSKDQEPPKEDFGAQAQRQPDSRRRI